jgi:ADP-heptose:LPS heptosyltransferase
MHLLEQYSLASGVKIKKPYIYEKFFPVTAEKYITFHPSSKPSKTYDYWQEVINIISPILDSKGIKIIQLGQEKEKVYSGVVSLVGFTNINQTAFILRDCLLHFGADSFPTHIASGYNKKIVALYSNN